MDQAYLIWKTQLISWDQRGSDDAPEAERGIWATDSAGD